MGRDRYGVGGWIRVDVQKAVGWMDGGADEQRQIWGEWMDKEMRRDRFGWMDE